jgi:hypothetical protein
MQPSAYKQAFDGPFNASLLSLMHTQSKKHPGEHQANHDTHFPLINLFSVVVECEEFGLICCCSHFNQPQSILLSMSYRSFTHVQIDKRTIFRSDTQAKSLLESHCRATFLR